VQNPEKAQGGVQLHGVQPEGSRGVYTEGSQGGGRCKQTKQQQYHCTGNNKKVILASLVPTHPGSASPFRTVIRLLLRAMGIRCSVSRLTRSPNGLTTLDTNLPVWCAMATPSLGRAIPRQGGIRPLMYVRQVQSSLRAQHGSQNDATRSLYCAMQRAGLL
jgi:hypothetical protein